MLMQVRQEDLLRVNIVPLRNWSQRFQRMSVSAKLIFTIFQWILELLP